MLCASVVYCLVVWLIDYCCTWNLKYLPLRRRVTILIRALNLIPDIPIR